MQFRMPLIIIVILFIVINPVIAQKIDPVFINVQMRGIKQWLDITNIDSALTYDSYNLKDERLTVFFKTSNFYNWQRFTMKTDSLFKRKITEIIIDKISFLTELHEYQIRIEIEGEDVLIFSYNNNGIVTDQISKKMGMPDQALNKNSSPPLSINNIETLRGVNMNTKWRSKLDNAVKNYFIKFKPAFETPTFETYDETSVIYYDIKNIKGAVLPNESFFEFVKIKVTATFDSTVTLAFIINAKYSAGIIWAPKNDRYKDVEVRYPEEFDTFCKKLKSYLNKSIN